MNFDPDKVPQTIDEAVAMVVAGLSEEDTEHIFTAPSCLSHHTLGRFLRNNWSMWEDTPMRRDFIQRFGLFGHGDDLSGMILGSVWVHVRKGPEHVAAWQKEEAEFYRQHWARHGINPATGEQER